MRITGLKIISSSLLPDKPIMSQLDSKQKDIPLQYLGFVQTPSLWFGNTIYGLNQFEYAPKPNTELTNLDTISNRLGKRVEYFVCHDLQQHPHISIIDQNLQIQQQKQTIGELDTLIMVNGKPVHLEIVYKFYVYDATVGINELDHWIGPNRKDSLIQKLDKLKNKQLPLLHHPETVKYLVNYGLNAQNIEQKVLFKAQLFIPYNLKNKVFTQINTDCIMGHYIKKEDLASCSNSQFYMPSKLNWLVTVQPDVLWVSYTVFMSQLQTVLENKLAPLIWIKHPNGNTQRCFVVWW